MGFSIHEPGAHEDMYQENNFTATIPQDHAGLRLDKSLAELFPQFSRAKIQTWIKSNHVRVDGDFQVNRYHVQGGEEVVLTALLDDHSSHHQGEDIPLDIVFEDEHLVVANKPVGLVVHPGAGNQRGTLMNALLYRNPETSALPRAGIVHRLDKDTSGILVAAKTLEAHSGLIQMLQERRVERLYYAVVRGQLISGGTIDAPIGRHSHDRIKMAINERGKAACTHFKVVEKFKRHTLVEAKLDTGRTHQIRVHFASKNHPLVGDSIYSSRVMRVANVPDKLNQILCEFPRQALHAFQLGFQHPLTKQNLSWQVDMPQDMQNLLTSLRKYSPL